MASINRSTHEILVVTRNRGKLAEIREILQGLRIKAISAYQEFDFEEVPETGNTYVENALLKGRRGFEVSRRLCVGEDSGLEVDVLNGAPGIYSARFGENLSTASDKIEKLLSLLEGIPPSKRSARFRAAVALLWQGGEKVFEGVCEGWISEAPRGVGGFGYDPVFVFPPYEKTFAELGPEVKNQYSHRAMAFRAMAKFVLEKGLASPSAGEEA